jgi:SAM-dependent methyltransferase
MRSLGFSLVRCKACDHRFSSEVLSSDVLALNYYDESETDIAARSMVAKRQRFREYIELLGEAAHAKGRVLDVGCNSGELLSLFQEAGWEPYGIEASPGPAEYARRRVRGTIWQGPVEDVLPDNLRFDLITASHVLEHLRNPVDVLSRLRGALATDGRLLLEVPNADDVLLDWWRGFYRPLCPGDHVSFFGPGNLHRLLQGQGFVIEKMISPLHARDFFYASLLSAVDASRQLMGRASHGAEAGGVRDQTRYRGRLRRPLRAVLDTVVTGLDPLAVKLGSPFAERMRGPVLIVVAKICR